MALSGWTKKCSIAIAANKLGYTQTNQVVMLDTAHFPTGMVTLGGADACKSDGGDIRFSTDANGDTLIPFDIVRISLNATPANSVLVCVFKTNVTANAAFTVYCHWGNPAASRVADADTVGAGNCWSELYGVLYLQEDPGTVSTAATQWKFFKEATGRYSAASEIGACQQVAGPTSGLKAVAINATNGIRIPEVVSTGASDTFTCAAFIRPAGTTYPGSVPTNDYSGAVFLAGASEMLIGWSTSGECKWQYAGGYANPQFGVGKGNKWRVWVTQVSGTSANFYLDPTAAAFSVGSITSLTNLQYLGGSDTGGTVKAGAYHICFFMIGKFALPNINFFRNLQNNLDNSATLATPGSIQSSSVAASLTLTGLVDGTEVRVYNGATEVAGVESSSGGTFTYNYSSAFTATIVIHNLGDQFMRYNSISLSSGGATIPIQQIDDLWYKGTVPANLNSTNITIAATTAPYTIKFNNSITATLQDLYSYLMQLWKSDATLISKPFPFVPITDEQFIMQDPWNFLDATTVNSIKGAGWSRRNSSNVPVEEYCNVTTLGTVSGTAYYAQTTSSTGAVTNAIASGAMNQAVKIYGDASNGNFDYRTTALRVYSRVLGQTYDSYDLMNSQGITTLTYRKYALPLANSTDADQVETNTGTLSAAPYSNLVISECNYDSVGSAWAISTAYVINKVMPATFGSMSGAWAPSTAYTKGQRVTVSGSDKGSWITGTAYAVGDIVFALDPTATGGDCIVRWYCYSAHTSGTFATDVTTKWVYYTGNMVCTVSHTSAASLVSDIANLSKWAPSNQWVRATSAHTSSATDIYADLASGKLRAYEGARYVNGAWKLFTAILDGRDMSLSQIYMAHNYRLTLATDILPGTKARNGKVADSYMSYVGSTLVTRAGVFIDNFAVEDLNKVEFYDYLGTKVIYPLTVTFSLTGLKVGTEVDVFDPNTKVSVDQIESTTGTTYTYSYQYTADKTVSIAIIGPDDIFLRYDNIVLGNASQSIPVQLQDDRWN